MAAPISTPLPPAPSRSEGEAVFVPKANAFLGALEPFRVDLQAQADFVESAAAAADSSAIAAADEAEKSRLSAVQANKNVANSGYQFVGDYAVGITLTEYNQVLRDSSGEFWRAAGSTPLPYTTTGAGVDEGGALSSVGDAALRQELAGADGYRYVAGQMAASAYGVPAKAVDVMTGLSNPEIVDYFDGFFWGFTAPTIYKSHDSITWTAVESGISFGVHRLLPTADGEVLAMDAYAIRKSAGFGTGSATWTEKIASGTGTQTPFLRWGLDGDGTKFIINHYGAGTQGDVRYQNSRYVWISTDSGDTWNIVWDTQAQFPSDYQDSHLHGVCYDKWADRFYFIEGHGAPRGLYYSDNDGATWTKLVKDGGLNPMPTTITATDFGIVFGTDSEPNGVAFLPRSGDPEAVGIEFIAQFPTIKERVGVVGFADRAFRDPDTGIVYIGYTSLHDDIPVYIFGVGAGGAGVVAELGFGSAGIVRVSNVVAANGRLIARHSALGNVSAKLPPFTQSPVSFDSGNVMPEVKRTQSQALAVGKRAVATGVAAISIGACSATSASSIILSYNGASAGIGGVSIGSHASSANYAIAIGVSSSSLLGGVSVGEVALSSAYSVALGYQADSSAAAGVSIGRKAKAGGSNAVAVGYEADCLSNSVSVGHTAKAQSQGVSVGQNAQAKSAADISIGYRATTGETRNNGQISIGHNSSVDANSGVAIGSSAQVQTGHIESVAIGRLTKTQRINSVCIGNRDLESTLAGAGVLLKSPNGTLYKLTIANGGTVTVTEV